MIGVILRENEDKYTLNKEIRNVITKYNYNFIAIYPSSLEDFKKFVKLCDGFILQGGSDYKEIEIDMVKYLYENDIPTLGICLGMQMMGVMNGKLGKLSNSNHQSKEKYVHRVIIEKNSKLYSIIQKEAILVNSRHNDYIEHTLLDVVARANDNVIEVIEDKNKTFFIGVQWHPETIMDENSEKLFVSFFQNLK